MISFAVSTLRMWFAVFLLDAKNSVIFGVWRVSGGRVYFPLCGSLPRGAVIGWPFISLEVFDWHGGRCCCAVFVGLHILCLSSWVCHVGLLFWLTIHFGGEI